MAALSSKESLKHSEKDYDWLGSGIYFWENDPQRALEWAQQKCRQGAYKNPFVIGAVVDLGNCLDLISRNEISILSLAYQSLEVKHATARAAMPKNLDAKGDRNGDKLLRILDCAVINHLHYIIETEKSIDVPPYDTVRGLFTEGDEAYPGARFLESTHTQIAVRNISCIKGYFLPPSFSSLVREPEPPTSFNSSSKALSADDWGGITPSGCP